ncbi:MAG: hypothetical protein ACI9LE_000573 [Paraglaciecola sp.]|jgi:hypothetical protein
MLGQNLFDSVTGIPVNDEGKSYQTYSFCMYTDENGLRRTGVTYLNGSGSANLYGSDYSGRLRAKDKRYYSTFLTKFAPKIIANFTSVSAVNAPVTSVFFILFGVILVKKSRVVLTIGHQIMRLIATRLII